MMNLRVTGKWETYGRLHLLTTWWTPPLLLPLLFSQALPAPFPSPFFLFLRPPQIQRRRSLPLLLPASPFPFPSFSTGQIHGAAGRRQASGWPAAVRPRRGGAAGRRQAGGGEAAGRSGGGVSHHEISEFQDVIKIKNKTTIFL